MKRNSPSGETSGVATKTQGELRTWSPPEMRILPLDLTGSGAGAPGNEHTPSTWTSQARTFDNRPPS